MTSEPDKRRAEDGQPSEVNEVYRLWQALNDPVDTRSEYRRREPRRVAPPGASVHVRAGDKAFRASITNLGQDGLGLFAKTELPERSIVQFRMGDEGEWLDARVVHCTTTVGGYKIGLEPA